jgi:hypothetical protein
MRSGVLISFAIGLLIVGVVGASLVGLGCDENLRPGTARTDVCTTVGEVGGFGWWSLGCAPALLFFAVGLVRGRSDRLAILAIAIVTALVAVDAILIAVVTSNLLA